MVLQLLLAAIDLLGLVHLLVALHLLLEDGSDLVVDLAALVAVAAGGEGEDDREVLEHGGDSTPGRPRTGV